MPRGRPREFDREAALRNAMLLFWRKGFYSTSIPDLCDALGIRPPSLYAAFGSKENLYVEALELYMKVSQTLLWDLLDTGRGGRAEIKSLLDAVAKEMTTDEQHPTGCFVTLATIDEDLPPLVRMAIRKGRQDWLTVIRAHVERAIERKELPASTNKEALTRFLVGMVQAIGIQSHDGATRAQMEAMVETAMAAWPKKTSAKISNCKEA